MNCKFNTYTTNKEVKQESELNFLLLTLFIKKIKVIKTEQKL